MFFVGFFFFMIIPYPDLHFDYFHYRVIIVRATSQMFLSTVNIKKGKTKVINHVLFRATRSGFRYISSYKRNFIVDWMQKLFSNKIV